MHAVLAKHLDMTKYSVSIMDPDLDLDNDPDIGEPIFLPLVLLTERDWCEICGNDAQYKVDTTGYDDGFHDVAYCYGCARRAALDPRMRTEGMTWVLREE